MKELKICKHSNGRGWCFVYETYCTEGPCEKEELVEYVPVVRCKDCEYYHLMEEGFYDCREVWGLDLPKHEDFCSYGKRREE